MRAVTQYRGGDIPYVPQNFYLRNHRRIELAFKAVLILTMLLALEV